jgi:hypothetical protein
LRRTTKNIKIRASGTRIKIRTSQKDASVVTTEPQSTERRCKKKYRLCIAEFTVDVEGTGWHRPWISSGNHSGIQIQVLRKTTNAMTYSQSGNRDSKLV